jgi:hypothetical protein
MEPMDGNPSGMEKEFEMNWKHATGMILLAAGMTHAHLVATSLVPKGGESLTVGDAVSIAWNTETTHGVGIDISFSKDAGTTWTDIKTGFNDNAKTNTFKWTVTASQVTTAATGLLRVCQSGPCTDQKVTKAGGNSSPWYLVSGALTVKASTAIRAGESAARGMEMDFDAATRNMQVSFGLDRAERVKLQAFDAQGRLVATLIEGGYAAGEHTLSVFSNRLADAGGSLVFKLDVGGQVKTLTWMSLQ